jgi:hypothetical protein
MSPDEKDERENQVDALRFVAAIVGALLLAAAGVGIALFFLFK